MNRLTEQEKQTARFHKGLKVCHANINRLGTIKPDCTDFALTIQRDALIEAVERVFANLRESVKSDQ